MGFNPTEFDPSTARPVVADPPVFDPSTARPVAASDPTVFDPSTARPVKSAAPAALTAEETKALQEDARFYTHTGQPLFAESSAHYRPPITDLNKLRVIRAAQSGALHKAAAEGDADAQEIVAIGQRARQAAVEGAVAGLEPYEAMAPRWGQPVEPYDGPPEGEFRAAPTITGELESGHVGHAASMAGEAMRRQFSGLLGPTESERSEGMVPVGRNPDGSIRYEYKPLADRLDRGQGLFTPLVEPPHLAPSESDSTLTGLGKGAFNTAAGLSGVFMSPLSAMLPGAASVPGASRIASGLFAADMLSGVPGELRQAVHGETPQEQFEGLLGAGASTVMGLGAAGHAMRRAPVLPPQAAAAARAYYATGRPDDIEGDFRVVPPGGDAPLPSPKPVPPPAPSGSAVPPAAQQEFESQLATQEGVTKGAPTVVLGTKGAEYPAVYAWAPRSLIQPSHSGELMAANPSYPLTNTRDYSDPAERDKALETRNTWDPRRAVTDSPDAAVGPPMVARVIDEDGQATLAVVGGNSRQWAMHHLSPEQQAAQLAQSNAKAGHFGLEPTADPDAQLIRHLGTFDFRKPGERARLQSMVDVLNPSPGQVQGSAKRAEIDAQNVPPDQLGDLSMDLAPADAQVAVRGLIERGLLDRNRTAAIASSGAQSQDYVQRLLVNAGFRVPQIAEARNDTRPGNATMRGLIDAATPALVRLRQRGANDVADAIARSFATILDTTKHQGIDSLPEAIQRVAVQEELDPAHAPAKAIAAGLAQRVVTDKAGRVQAEPTIAAARDYFTGIERAVSQHQEGADLFGGSRSMAETVEAGASMVVREDDTVGEPVLRGLDPSQDHLYLDNREQHRRNLGRAIESAQTHLGTMGSAVPAERRDAEATSAAVRAGAIRELDSRRLQQAIDAGELGPNFGRHEHDVYRAPGGKRVLKLTRGGGNFGFVGADTQGRSLLEYLHRLDRLNAEVDDDLALEGVIRDANGDYRAVISQPWIEGRQATPQEIAAYFRAKGYEQFGSYSWWHGGKEITMNDAEGVNILFGADGKVYPIDVIPKWDLSPRRIQQIEMLVEGYHRQAADTLREEGAKPTARQREAQRLADLRAQRAVWQAETGAAPQAAGPEPVAGLRDAYEALAQRTGFPAVGIAQLAQEAGQPLPEIQTQLLALQQQGRVVLSVGDWSLADAATRAGAIKIGQGWTEQRFLQVRFLPVVDLQEAAAKVAPYLDAQGITDPSRRAAGVAEFTRWQSILEDARQRAAYRQLDLDFAPVPDRGGGTVAGGTAPGRTAAGAVSGAHALDALARGLGIAPADLDAAFLASGDTISSIVTALLEDPARPVNWIGAKIVRAADFALLKRALRTPLVEVVHFAIVDPRTQQVVAGGVSHVGTLSESIMTARDVIREVARLPALPAGMRYQVYNGHNHPSGVPAPSSADLTIVPKLQAALEAAGINFVDHIITNGHEFFSVVNRTTMPYPDHRTTAAWEALPRHALATISAPEDLRRVAGSLRTASPGHYHLIYGTTQYGVAAIQRLPDGVTVDRLVREILQQGSLQGARFVWVSSPTTSAADSARLFELKTRMAGLKGSVPQLLDIATTDVDSFTGAGLLEAPPRYRTAGGGQLAVQASALEALREEGPEYSPLKALNSAGGAHADVPLHGLHDIKIIQMPEMVQLARDLMGQLPDLRRMRPLGTFRPLGNGEIALDPRIFANPVEAAKVLAHEVGHLASWFPQRDISRGNLHGHLHSLHAFMRDRFGAANTSNRDMRAELIALTRYWRPYDPATSTPGFVRYRESASELYADAVSVLFNSPATLKQMAPKFYHEFFRGLDTKPEVKRAFLDLQAWLNRPMMAQLKLRSDKVSVMFGAAEAIFERKWQEREERYKGFGGWLSRLKQGFFDNFSPIVDREAAAGQSQAADSARFFFDEHPLVAGNQSYRWLERMHRTVAVPAEAAGFSLDQVGQLLFFHRIANERYDVSAAMQERLGSPVAGRSAIANPQGHTPDTARLCLLQMRLENGMRGQTMLESAVQRFHDQVYDVMRDAHDAGLLTDEQMSLIDSNRDNYATFTPIEHVDLYLPAGFFAQAGTLKEIQNPFVSTVSKTLTMIRAIQHNRAKATTVRILQRDFPGEIEPAVTVRDAQGREQPKPPRDKSQQQIMLRAAGRPAWFNVPKEIALMFERPDVPLLDSALELLNTPFRKFFYPLFITFNPVFQLLRNPIRDARRSFVNMPGTVGLAGIARQLPLVKQIGRNEALDGVRALVKQGRTEPIIAEMLENLAITPGEATFNATAGQPVTSFDRMLQQFGVLPEEQARWRATRLPVIGKVLGAIETAGRMNELLPKVSAYQLLRNRAGWSPREAAFYVRNYTGTPNFAKRGRHIGLLGPIFPFVNVWLRGWAADSDLARRGYQRTDRPDQPGKSPASFWFRWAATSGIWTVMKVAASLGLLGLALKKLMDGVSDHYKTNYDILPIGRVGTSDFDPDGKVAFIPIPKDPVDRIISGILYNTLRAAGAAAAKSGMFGDEIKAANANVNTDLATAAAKNLSLGASDVPGLNPLIKMAGAWSSYIQGQNPVDDYRNQPILSDAEFLAGGWNGVKPMLAWSYKQTGASSFVSYNPDAGFTLEQAANLPLINGMVKVTDYGYREQQKAAQSLEQAAAARIKLDMPANAQRLAGEYGMLSRLDSPTSKAAAAGSAAVRTDAQEERYQTLKAWHQQYRAAEEQLTNAKENDLSPADRKSILQSVQDMSKDYERKP